jgi:hypothetical protein
MEDIMTISSTTTLFNRQDKLDRMIRERLVDDLAPTIGAALTTLLKGADVKVGHIYREFVDGDAQIAITAILTYPITTHYPFIVALSKHSSVRPDPNDKMVQQDIKFTFPMEAVEMTSDQVIIFLLSTIHAEHLYAYYVTGTTSNLVSTSPTLH